jgi:SNF family Na+-dependent transporter
MNWIEKESVYIWWIGKKENEIVEIEKWIEREVMKMEENGKSNRKELLATGFNHHPLPKVFSSFSFNYFFFVLFFQVFVFASFCLFK